MDPNQTGSYPPQGPGYPPQAPGYPPQAPGYGQPAGYPPQAPGYGQAPQPQQPPEWAQQGYQPQQPQFAPPTPNLGWAPTVPPKRRRLLPRLLGVVVVVAVVIALAGIGILTSNKGKVMFTTQPPANVTECSIGTTTDTVTSAEKFYITGIMKKHMNGTEPVVIRVNTDEYDVEDGGGPYDCLTIKDAVGPLDAGSYKFQFVVDGEVQAEGTISVTEPK